ncbi:esterase [Candidatus Latescibacterota bacterium]
MKKPMVFMLTLSFALVLISSTALAWDDPATSPVFNDDRTVTFRLNAPKADNVKLNVEFLPEPQPMIKNNEGVWELTVGPAEPKIYYYSFLVDSVSVIDPQNPQVKSSLLPNESIFNYPGDEPQFYDQKDVPHGVIHTHYFFSELEQANRTLIVYTPPEYDPHREYPVLYLFHGYSDNERGWVDVGKANFIMDNLIAETSAVPMIVVMPFGYSEPQPGDNVGDQLDLVSFMKWQQHVIPRFERDIVEEVIPLVESAYTTASGAKNRAIAGLSMGGIQSLYLGLNNLDKFSWIGAFSAGFTMDLLGSNPAHFNDHCSLLWVAIGEDEFLLESNNQFAAALKAKGIDHEYHLTEGGHTWWVWHRHLRDFAPRLFK